ncbi:hypothetical protein [Pseudactinotalea terrae]|uniref:hypothetical protein n=1 Tax=Pseudactinotalea terrae TaxID=1743262 RepID=UPI0012E279E6|nr:hypothetical protein [Pseudactinotalea terrae]
MSLDILPPPGEFKTTEEIRDAKFAEELRTKRKRLLLWSAPLMLIALLAALKLLSAVAVNMAGSSAYDHANYNTAADRFESLEFFNVIEPWKAHFNQGTAVYASGQFFQSTQHLAVALDLVPKAPQGEPPAKEECDVRTNYSLALEGLGDEAMAASDPAMGADYYAQAQEMLSNCGEGGGNGGEEAQEAEERQEESQGEAEEQQQQQEQEGEEPTDGESSGESETPTDGESSDEGESPTDGESSGEGESESPSESGSGGESQSTDPQQEELESRNEEAQQSADAEEQASGGGNGSGQNW